MLLPYYDALLCVQHLNINIIQINMTNVYKTIVWSFCFQLEISSTLWLCLVGVKRFPENTYFPEMLISGKGKCFHGVWLHFKKFSGKHFLVFGKEEGKHK